MQRGAVGRSLSRRCVCTVFILLLFGACMVASKVAIILKYNGISSQNTAVPIAGRTMVLLFSQGL